MQRNFISLLIIAFVSISSISVVSCGTSDEEDVLEEVEENQDDGNDDGDDGNDDKEEDEPEEEVLLPEGLIAYFDFDEELAKDLSGNKNNGSLRGTPSFTEGITGKAISLNADAADNDNACGLPGGDFLLLPTIDAVWENGFTVTTWVQFSENRNYERILDFGNGRGEAGGQLITFSRLDSTNSLALTSWQTTDSLLNRTEGRIVAENAITNGSWQYVSGTISPTGRMRIYLGGELVAEKENGYAVVNTERVYNRIGKSSYCNEDPDFKGKLDEFRVYNRELSEEEISTLYADDDGKK